LLHVLNSMVDLKPSIERLELIKRAVRAKFRFPRFSNYVRKPSGSAGCRVTFRLLSKSRTLAAGCPLFFGEFLN